ncbi:hypothetical protein GCM10027299_20080 [Larkinella ripae]
MAYLITCSGSKKIPPFQPSNINNLSYSELTLERDELIKRTNIELDWSRTLPAWQLYSGKQSKIYSKIPKENWGKPNIDVKILSALFGWIRHTDLIPYYDLVMNSRIPSSNECVHNYWFKKKKLHLFFDRTDIDLLSNNYRKAVSGRINPIATVPNINWKDNYGSHKGNWLNIQLELQ